MKKFIATLSAAALLIGFGDSAAGQNNQLDFQTFEVVGGQLLDEHIVFLTDGATRAQGPGIAGRIFIGSTSDFGTMTAIGNGAAPFATVATGGAGFIDASQLNAGLITATGFDSGQSIFYSLAAWDTSTGSSFGEASIRGNSTPVAITVGGAGSPAAPPPTLNTFTSFNLEVVPEPSTVALGVIGGLALLMRRRK